MAAFVEQFRSDPEAALDSIVTQSSLPRDAATLARLLHQTPDLDREQLTRYLCRSDRERRAVMQAYLGLQRYAGVSIESALRSLLLQLRFPADAEEFEALLVSFSRKWTEANRGLIKEQFSTELATNLVLAIMALNDALYSHEADKGAPGFFSDSMPTLGRHAFLSAFREHDESQVLSDRTLLRIFSSVRSDPIAQALAADEPGPRHVIRIDGGAGLPSKLVYGQTSAPVSLSIPAPDPDFALRLYGQDIVFEPPVLSFDKSTTQTFTMTSRALGAKTAVFVRAGRNARYYVEATAGSLSSLPVSASMTVERAFMQNCFTITLPGVDASATKRRYMFSVDDEASRHVWTRKLVKAIEQTVARRKLLADEIAEERASRKPSAGLGPAATRKAANALALHVLRETLIAPEQPAQAAGATSPKGTNASLQRSASSAVAAGPRSGFPPLARSAGAASNGFGAQEGSSSLQRAPSDSRVASSRITAYGANAPSASALERNQSVSRHYYAGAGRTERELLPSGAASAALPALLERSSSGHAEDTPPPPPPPKERRGAAPPSSPLTPVPGAPLPGTAIVVTCTQNSLLPLLLSLRAE
jgi:hypothetical protein